MSFLNDFPHVRQYDGDLGWLIRQVQANMDSITSINSAIQQIMDNIPEEVREQIQALVDDGTIAQIIQQLLTNELPIYETAAAMCADTALAVGKYALTAGYASRDDGGHGLYYISDPTGLTVDGGKYLTSSNGVAILITGADVSVKQYGATGDGVTDDFTALNACMQYCMTAHKRMIIPAGVYMTSEMLLGYENYDFSILGIGNPIVKFIYRLDRGSAHAVIGFEGCHDFSLGGIEIDCSEVLGINGTGGNGRNNADLLMTNVHFHDLVIRNCRISDTDLGGHAFTFQYNIGRALVENLTVYDSDIALDVTGVTAAYSMTTGSYASGVLVDGLYCYNCETVMTSYDLQTNVQIMRRFNLITVQNIYAYRCGVSKYAGQTNNHLNDNAAGDGTDGGIFEFIGATRGITIRDALIDNTDYVKIGGVVRGKGCYCTLENVTFLGDAVAVYNTEVPYNIKPVSNDSGAVYYAYSDFNTFSVKVTGSYDFFVKAFSMPDVADPFRIRYARFYVRAESVGTTFGAFCNIQIPINHCCFAELRTINAMVNGDFYYLYLDFSTTAYSDTFSGVTKIVRSGNLLVTGNNTTQNISLQRAGDTRPSTFRIQTDGGTTSLLGGLTDFSKTLAVFKHNNSITSLELAGTYNSGVLKIGTIYIWQNGNNLFYKVGTAPASASDGNQLNP